MSPAVDAIMDPVLTALRSRLMSIPGVLARNPDEASDDKLVVAFESRAYTPLAGQAYVAERLDVGEGEQIGARLSDAAGAYELSLRVPKKASPLTMLWAETLLGAFPIHGTDLSEDGDVLVVIRGHDRGRNEPAGDWLLRTIRIAVVVRRLTSET